MVWGVLRKGFLDDWENLAGDVLGNPLIRSLAEPDRLPSYLPGRAFSAALLEAVRRRGGGQLDLDELRIAIGALPEGPARALLGTSMNEAGTDLAGLRSQLETWYDDAMDRVSGWYKREVQRILLVLGFLVAIALNVDSIHLAGRLAEDPVLRERLVAAAEKLNTDQTLDELENEQLEQLVARIEDLDLPIGWSWPPPQLVDRPKTGNGELSWDAVLAQLPLMILGWLLTGVALSLGAPFWFDLMGRIMKVRGAGVLRSATETGAPRIQPDAGAGGAAAALTVTTPPSAAPSEPTPPAQWPDPKGANAFEINELTTDDIRDLQRALGMREPGVNGQLDAPTRLLIWNFQKERGRTPDGILTAPLAQLILDSDR
jgi:hypothetical protein